MSTALARRSSSWSLTDRARLAWRSFWQGPFSSKDPALAKLFGSGYEAAAGIHVTPENAFTFSAVFDAVNQIASDEAKLPLNLLKKRDDGGSDLYEDSGVYKLLKYEPNPEMSPMVFRRTLIAHALTCHGGFAEIERDTLNRPFALWILTPDRVEPYRDDRGIDSRTGQRVYGPLEYKIDGGATFLPAKDVLHIHGLGYDGITGYSVIDKARQTIGLALAAEKFGANYFGKGTMFGGWLENESDLDEDQKKEIRENIDKFRAQQDAAFRILVTGAGQKFHQFANKPSESQMDESRLRQVEEVARFFRMPPYKLGVNTPGTVSYASVEAANLDYYTGCLLDWITLVEQEFNRKLIPRLERGRQFIKHNVNAFLRADTAARSAFYQAMLDRGVFSADMVLGLEDMNPQPNGQGKLLLVQGAMIPKDKLVEKIEADLAKAKAETDKIAREPVSSSATPSPDANAPIPEDEDRDRLIVVLREDLAEAQTRSEALRDEIQRLIESGQAKDADVDILQRRHAEADLTIAALKARIETAMTERQAEADARVTADEALASESTARQAAERIAHDERLKTEAAERAASAAAQRQAEAEDRAATAQERADEAVAERDRLAATHETDQVALSAAHLAVADAEQRVAELDAERERLTTVAAQAQADAERITQESTARIAIADATAREADAQARAAEQRTADLETARQAAEAERERLTTVAEQAQADADRIAHEAATRIATAAAATEDAESRARMADARAADLEAIRQAADAEQQRIAIVAEERHATNETLSQSLNAMHARAKARQIATIAAHRGLIVDALGRMARREAQQARSKQATPEKLRRWLDGFTTLQTAICTEALLPAVRTHLAWLESDDDPAIVTAALVQRHLVEFDRQLRVVLEADPEDFHAELDAVLMRWESDRPAVVADAFVTEEIRHVASD